MLLKRKNEIMVGNLGILIIIDNSFDNAPIVYFWLHESYCNVCRINNVIEQ